MMFMMFSTDRLFETSNPSIGLAIGTFAAVPYVHLALESHRRNYPDLPVLIHDDASPQSSELRDLCEQYGARFHSNEERIGWLKGDLSCYVHALRWARRSGIELLVKMSRRFIPLYDWTSELAALAWQSQYATYGQRCLHFNFGLRTECVAFHVGTWAQESVLTQIEAALHSRKSIQVEGFMHGLAREVHQSACEVNRAFEREHPRPAAANAFGVWKIMPNRRVAKSDRALWHDCDRPADYARAAMLYGLPWRRSSFHLGREVQKKSCAAADLPRLSRGDGEEAAAKAKIPSG